MASLVFENKVKAWEKSRLEVRKYISDPQFAEQDGYFSEVEQMAFGGYWWLAHFSRFLHSQSIDIQRYCKALYRDTNP